MLNKALTYSDDAFQYLISGSVVKRLGIGGLMAAFSTFVLPGIYLFGYYIEIMKNSLRGDDIPPEFQSTTVVNMLKQGVVGVVLVFIYSIPPLLVFGGVLAIISSNFSYSASLLITVVTIAAFGLFVLSLYLWVVIPAAFALYIESGKITTAFSPSGMKDIIATKEYVIAYAISMFLTTAASVSVIFAGVIPVVGFVIIGLIQFSVLAIIYRVFAIAISDSSEFVYNTDDDTSRSPEENMT